MADLAPDLPFERVDAAAFTLLYLDSDAQIGTAPDRSHLFALLEEIREQDETALPRILVVAVDDKGQRMGSWRASSLFADA